MWGNVKFGRDFVKFGVIIQFGKSLFDFWW